MTSPAAHSPVPHLQPIGSCVHLVVDGQPFLAIGGELHNSSSSDPHYMEKIWSKLADSGIGTVLATASWDQIEPTEGQFDFSPVNALLQAAGARSIRLVLIWFGAFKNAHSLYAPTWVRRDRARFPRAHIRPGGRAAPFTYDGAMQKPVLSVFSPELLAAERCAYVALLGHLATHDTNRTVIMVQVNNEVGLLGDSRDRSPLAESSWNAPLPAAVRDALSVKSSHWLPPVTLAHGQDLQDRVESWADVFGDDPLGDELFMAWAFASYIEQLAAAGKDVLPIPVYANAWLGPQPGQELPGHFPSGGPTARMMGIWKTAAPTLDFLAPDVYIDDVETVMAQYAAPDNPLFIPEAKFRTGDLFLALGRYRAIGYCVFGIEDGRRDSQFATAVTLLQEMSAVITHAQAENLIHAVLLDQEQETATATLAGYTLTIRDSARLFARMLFDAGVEAPGGPPELPSETDSGPYGPEPGDHRPFGMVIATGPDEFLVMGQGFTIDFSHPAGTLEIDQVREGRYVNNAWVNGRILNGDERLQILPLARIGAAKITLMPSRH